MKTTDVKKGQLVLTPAFAFRRGIDRTLREWKIRARVVGPGPNGMVALEPADTVYSSTLGLAASRTIHRRPCDLAAA